VLFAAQRDSDVSEKWENLVLNLREDLVDTLGAWVVRAENSAMARLYNPKAPNQPFIVYFRHGVALLYDGRYSSNPVEILLEPSDIHR
jgi:hypothetical protein